jgi:hypothetical protein
VSDRLQAPRPRAAKRKPAAGTAGQVLALDRARIERALDARSRYRYVQPRVEPEGAGWKVLSPNCSRSIDAAGGEIAIAWLESDGAGHWVLHARDHRRACWVLDATGLTLDQALARLCTDPLGRFWV